METAQICKVLVVEDEGLIAHDIATRLEAMGHQVVATVGTADEALEHAPKADVVLMDIHIDGQRDGVETAAEIRERFRIPVIFLTAHSDRATLDRAKQASPFGYIVKPLAPASLHASIEIARYKHRMERTLEEREAWQRTILASVADGVIVTGPDARVRLLNRAAEALTGWTQAEAEGQPVSKVVRLVDPADAGPGAPSAAAAASITEDPLALAILTDGPAPLDRSWRLVARGGRDLAVEGTAAPVKAAGDPLGAVLTLRDVSLLRWEETQLRQSQKMEAVGRLAAGVASEFTNLFAIIRTRAERLREQFAEYTPARDAIEEIHQAATAASQITHRLAFFSTRQVGHLEVLNLNAILRRMAKLIESVAGGRVKLAIRPDPLCGRIRADRSQVEQAVLNLVMHACAAMPEGGRLLIETGNLTVPTGTASNDYAFLGVTHSGSEPDPEWLFEPVSTGESSNLALSLVHGIVSEHGGYVSAQPAPAGGYRFEMLLPVWNQPAVDPREAGAPAARSILLVDPRERVRAQLHNFFEAAGYNLLEAGDAEEAVALGLLHDGPLELVIAAAAEAGSIVKALRGMHPTLSALRVVQSAEPAAGEIRAPFTQATLLERVAALVPPPPLTAPAPPVRVGIP